MMSTIQAVFFDLGDTLVHISPNTKAKICRKISAARGVQLNPDDYESVFHEEWKNRSDVSETVLVKDIRTDPSGSERLYWKGFFESLLPALGVSSYQADLIEWLIDVYTNPRSFVCFDEVYTVLFKLTEMGLILGIISNAFPSADKILDYHNLTPYFKYIFLSYELPYAKPEIGIYQLATQKTKIPLENTIFVDDRWSFVKGALEANMNAWLIERVPQKSSDSYTKSLVNKIKNLKELQTLVERSHTKNISHREQSLSIVPQKDINSMKNICELSTK